ncbi:MAG TPA: ABC transporter ATP-binding protein [Streptosporangiaceae bacterium]
MSIQGLRSHYLSRPWWPGRRPGGERAAAVRAVDGVDLEIGRGQVVCLVGESGSGKTTLGRAILGLAPITGGQILFDGQDIAGMRGGQIRRLRPKMQMIFQDPHGSLSPRRRVAQLLAEPYRVHQVPASQRYSVADLLEMVELSPKLGERYPHELSGGQARRVGIARALALHPDFLVADEPTAGIDVSGAAKILRLLRSLRAAHQLSYLVITHNLRIVDHIADRLAVMYLGKIAEEGPAGQVLDAPGHPYTRALLESVSEPDPHQRGAGRPLLPGEIPSPRNPPQGCAFHPRCRYREPACESEPPVTEVAAGHRVSCHFAGQLAARTPSGGPAGPARGTSR